MDEEGEEEEVGSGFGREGVDVGRGGGGYFNFSISDFSTLDIFSSILGGFRIRWGGGRGGGSGRYNRRRVIRKTLPGLWTYSEENVFQSEFSCPQNCPSPGNNFGLTQPPAHSEETGSGTKSWRWNWIYVKLFLCFSEVKVSFRWLPDFKYELEYELQDDWISLREQKAKYQLSVIMMDDAKLEISRIKGWAKAVKSSEPARMSSMKV